MKKKKVSQVNPIIRNGRKKGEYPYNLYSRTTKEDLIKLSQFISSDPEMFAYRFIEENIMPALEKIVSKENTEHFIKHISAKSFKYKIQIQSCLLFKMFSYYFNSDQVKWPQYFKDVIKEVKELANNAWPIDVIKKNPVLITSACIKRIHGKRLKELGYNPSYTKDSFRAEYISKGSQSLRKMEKSDITGMLINLDNWMTKIYKQQKTATQAPKILDFVYKATNGKRLPKSVKQQIGII